MKAPASKERKPDNGDNVTIKPLSRDDVFMRLFEATLIGAVSSFRRNSRRSLCVEEALILQETELAWKFAKRARELIDIEEARAEICERFNRGLVQAKPESGNGDNKHE